MNQGIAAFDRLQSDLEGLPVPPGDESTVSAMWAAQRRYVDKLKELRDAAAAGDASKLDAVNRELSPVVTAADAKLDDYGLDVCGSNFGG